MFVHSCCCIGIFGWSGLIQIQKRIQNNLKNALKYLKRKKKKSFFPLPSFRPIKPSSLSLTRSPLSSMAHLLPRAWSSPSPRDSPLGPSPVDGPVRVQRFPSLTACRWHHGPTRQDLLFLHAEPISFLVLPIESASKSPSFLTWSTPELFILSLRTPLLHLTLTKRTDVIPRRLRSSRSRSRLPSRAPHRLRADSVFVSYLGELAMFSTSSRCFSFAR
jgi:hypothetical protein